MTLDEIRAELAAIGSTYHGGPDGWEHKNPERGKVLVKELIKYNVALAATFEDAPARWGPRGEPGTVWCPGCGKRGQEPGTVCDSCGYAV